MNAELVLRALAPRTRSGSRSATWYRRAVTSSRDTRPASGWTAS